MHVTRCVGACRSGSRLVAAVLGLWLALPLRVAAQAAGSALSGVVTDSSAGVGIAGVEVSIVGTTLRAVTDERGRFLVPRSGTGPWTLQLRRLGFRPLTVTVGVDRAEAALDARLASSMHALAPVQVRAERTRYTGRLAGYYERVERRTNGGLFITRADLEREQPPQLTDMLQRSPGVRITRGRPGAQSVRMRGRECRPIVWLDGAPMSSADVDLDSFSPESLEGIEMYLGAGNAPARFQMARGQSECGTILLWSRSPDLMAHALKRGATPETLEALLTSLSVYTSEEVDEVTKLAEAGIWEVPYPASMRASGIAGRVVAEFVVDTLGRVEGENFGIVSSTHSLFTEAVRQAAQTVVFQPARRQGRRVRQLVRQPFDFQPAK